jgi:hypothetical protein
MAKLGIENPKTDRRIQQAGNSDPKADNAHLFDPSLRGDDLRALT